MSEAEPRTSAGPAGLRYVDLTLGAWRPWEAAKQLAAALGVALPPVAPIPTTEADEVDIGAVGDPIVFHAHEVAARVAAAMPSGGIIAVLTPRYGLPLRQDNEWLFLFLKRRGISLAVVGEEPATTVIGRSLFERRAGVGEPDTGPRTVSLTATQERLLGFFPGFLPRSLAAELDVPVAETFLAPAGPDHFLIPPAWRDRDPRTAAQDIDAMAGLEARDDGFAAFAECHCTAHFADVSLLCALGGRMEAAGALDIASTLAERARQVARGPEDMATADVRRQEVRLRLGRFKEALALPQVSRRAPEAARHRLGELKLRAALAVGRTAGLHADLGPLAARLDAGEPLANEEFRLLDDHAAALAEDEPARAFALAEQVGGALDDAPDADPRMVWRNALNLARFYRRRGDGERHSAALDRAFATSRGLRSLGEIVEMNIMRAIAEAEPTAPAAQRAWLRAALAWLAFVPPEAAPLGIVHLLFGTGADYVRARLDIDISEGLADRMAVAWPELSAAVGGEYAAVRACPWPDRGATDESARPRRILGGPGASVGWMESSEASPIYVRPRVRLVRFVEAALTVLCPEIARLERGVFLVDANAGIDIPATRAEALSVALRTRATELVFGTDRLVLDPGARLKIIGTVAPRLAPAVSVFDADDGNAVCRFARHRPDVTLTGEHAAAALQLRDVSPMTLGPLRVVFGKTVAETETLYRELEALGVARMDVDAPVEPVARKTPKPAPSPPTTAEKA